MSLLVVAGIVGIGGLLIAGSIAFYRWFYRVPAEAKVDSDVPRSKAAGREKTLRCKFCSWCRLFNVFDPFTNQVIV